MTHRTVQESVSKLSILLLKAFSTRKILNFHAEVPSP
jgi:hypothetical protein